MKSKIIVLFLLFCLYGFSQEIEEVFITGNKKTKTAFIKRIIKTRESTPIDSLQLEKDVEQLKRLPGIAYANYQIKYTEQNKPTVVFTVEENFSIIPSLNVYTTNKNEFAYRIGLYEFNALGKGYQIGGFFQRDIFNSYAFLFKAPFLFSPKWGLGFTHQNLTTFEPLYFNAGTANYRYNNNAFELALIHSPSVQHRFETAINYFTENYAYIDGVIDEGAPQELTIDKTLFKLFYEYNNTRTNYQYITGIKNQFRFQYVEEINVLSPSFLIALNDFFYFKKWGVKSTWASRFRIGFATNNNSPFAPFALDNNINVRGVGNTIDRGTASIVLNTEWRYTLFEKKWFVLQSNAFIDTGAWREPGGTLNDFTKKENIKLYPGIGLRLIHKRIFNAIFRIDYGFGVMKDATHGMVFGIGQYF